MGDLKVVGPGRNYNYLSLATLTLSLAENALYPKARLFDGRPEKDFRFTSNAADPAITADINRVTNPGLETWSGGLPSGWTKSGTVVETTTAGEVRSGSAAKVSAGSYLQQDIATLRSGELLNADIWARISASGAVAALHIINPFSGKYLTSAGAWSATPQATTNTTSTSYVNLTKQFSAEAYAVLLNTDVTTLRLRLAHDGGSEFAFFDDVTLYPGVDFLSIHGHNLDPHIVQQLRSSTDNFGAVDTIEGTAVLVSPSFYIRLGSVVYRRWWRLAFNGGANTAAIEVGEAVIAQTVQPLQKFEAPIFWRHQWDRQWSRTPSGSRFGHKRTKFKRRFPTLTFHFSTQAQIDDAFAIWDRAEGGTYPVVIVPDTDRPEVIHGYLPDEFSFSRELAAYYEGLEISVDESPFASTE